MKLLAPNGKPSNLTPEQYRLVRTPEFISWFGNWIDSPETASKVVDENGEPLVVYHFTDRQFNTFELKGLSKGFFFTENKNDDEFSYDAVKYYIDKGEYPLWIKELLRKGLSIEKIKEELNETKYQKVKAFFLNIRKMYPLSWIGEVSDKNWSVPYFENLYIDKARERSFNGIEFIRKSDKKRIIVALEPNQIKLADGTNTTFDSNNPDIRFMSGGNVLLAPNGQPSNLTPEQYRLVRTPQFISWFGNWEKAYETGNYKNVSKVIDKNGEPLVVWHGTDYVINEFMPHSLEYSYENGEDKFEKKFRGNLTLDEFKKISKEKGWRFQEPNYWFSKNNSYSWRKIQYPCFLKIINLKKYALADGDAIPYIFKENNLKDFGIKVSWRKKAYMGDEYYVVTKSNQIKLADGTNTTFDSNNDDIRYVNGGTPKLNLIKTYLHKDEYNDTEYLAFGYNHNRVFAIRKNEFTESFMKETIREYYNNVSIIKFGKLFRKHIYPYFSAEFNKYRIKPNFTWKELSSYIIGDGDYSIKHEQFLSFCKDANINLPKLADGTNTTFDSNNPDIRFMSGGNVLLAPNGQPSNLTPKQYRLVRTPQFKAFFGDWINSPETSSKVVDENGEPLVVYHGTENKFNIFKINTSHYGRGVYFTLNFEYAKEYAEGDEGKKGRVIKAFLNLRNPAYIDNSSESVLKFGTRRFYRDDIEGVEEEYIELLKDGYDGKIFKSYSDMFIVLKNTQIKLADGTNTTFDSNNPDIRFRTGGSIRKPKKRTISQTPAPKKDRIYGSKINKPKSSESKSKASSIILSPSVIKSIRTKINQHNEEYPNKKIPLSSAKAVVRRGMGAYSSTHRPTISGGKPNSRVAWGLARLNAFIYKIVKGKSKSGKYKQDDDLINELGYRVKPYAYGGQITDEQKETYKKWKELVNMSRLELEKFYNSKEGKVAGLSSSEAKKAGIDSGRESARWIMKMKYVPVKEWNSNMWRWAKKQISFISRMSGVKGKLYDEKGRKTRKHLALLIWGHNPEK